MHGLLPLGSVVKLKNSSSTIMVIGYFPTDHDNKIYNYLGISYPAGIGISDKMIMFDETSAESLLYIGYQDEQTANFCKLLENILAEILKRP